MRLELAIVRVGCVLAGSYLTWVSANCYLRAIPEGKVFFVITAIAGALLAISASGLLWWPKGPRR